MTFSDEGYDSYQVTDADFESACQNAPFWMKKRLLKKMQKVTYRAARWAPGNRPGEKGWLVRKDLPPSDVEEAVKRFVWRYK